MRTILELVFGLLYPWRCPFCGRISKTSICPDCREKLPYIGEPRCRRCGKPVRYEEQEYCYDCAAKTHNFCEGRSIWLHKGDVAVSIYNFKYHNRRIYARCYAKEMVRCCGSQMKKWGIDGIVPIPVSKKRLRKRGYNQALCLAEEIGRLTGIPVFPGMLVRVKETIPQKKLDPKIRAKNLKGAFSVVGNNTKLRRILLVDDIYTTGSTVDEAAQILKNTGVLKVYFLTISIGQGF